MNKRLIVIIIVGVVLVGGLLVFGQVRKSSRAAQLKPQALAELQRADFSVSSADNKAYVTGLFEKAHPAGAKALGGLLGTNLDENTYYTGLYTEMVRLAKADGRNDVATSLRNFAAGRKVYVEIK